MNSEPIPDGLLRLSLPGEQWRTSEALDRRYFVSTLGRLASSQYRGTKKKWGVIHPAKDSNGYLRTMLFLVGSYRTVKIHRLVAQVWIGAIPHRMTVHHRDFNRTNNAVGNLEIITLRENIQESAKVGRYGKSVGSINGNSKLTEDQVREIRRLFKPHVVMQKDLATRFGVSRITIQRVLKRGWRHVV